MADDADHNLSHLLVRKIEHPVIPDPDAPTIPVPQLLATARKSVALQPQQRLRDSRLNGCGKASEFLLCVPCDLDAPTHVRTLRSLSTSRNGWCGWRRRASNASVSARSSASFESETSFSRIASRSRRFNALKAVTKTSAVASVALISCPQSRKFVRQTSSETGTGAHPGTRPRPPPGANAKPAPHPREPAQSPILKNCNWMLSAKQLMLAP